MPDFINSLSDGFMPHGYCLKWDGPLIAVFIAGNVGIAIAYFLIPAALRYFIGKRTDLPYAHMFKLFAAFILSCGITHLIKVWTLFQPAYWIEAGVDLFTALVSLLTAALLYPLIPKALQLRSPRELELANAKLQEQIAATETAQRMADSARVEAEASRDAAVKANQLKSEFMANISHEIRTPLSGVMGMAELLCLQPTSKDAPEIATHLFDSSKRLMSVLNSLLDFAKLEAGKLQVESVVFSPARVVQEVVTLVKPAAQGKNISLNVDLDAKLPESLIGDEDKIRQVLLNLAHNAIKFTDKGGVQIAVVVENQTDKEATLDFSVTDTGIGISAAAQPKLFQPFVQADGSTSRRFGGTGLGLAIAKQFVGLMNGQISMHSEEGKGSKFSFMLKLEKGQ